MARSIRLGALRRLRVVSALIGVLLCASSAALISLLFQASHIKFVLPLVFLGLITAVALRYGMAAGIVGSLVSALIFAVFLFKPSGPVVVFSDSAKASLAWLLMGGAALSFLFAPHRKA